MLIKFNDIVKKYGKPKGIIHIGAHLMEERNDYLSNDLDNTIWIEANPKISMVLHEILGTDSKELIFNSAISDNDDAVIKFNITNNGQSSSILELGKHKIHHPHIYVSEIIDMKTKRMDSLIKENLIDIEKYDFLNLDIQGAELLALKGFGNLLNNIKYIYTEINTEKLYVDCALLSDIDLYLEEFGFIRVETQMTEFEWGDALYIKK
jgi:FkbM family methyltransferase